MTETYGRDMQALLWTCTSCGFTYEGGQPKMECPVCEAYKTAFIDIPQHLEQEVRSAHPDVPFNHAECRKQRLALMAKYEIRKNHRVAGRILPAASGNNIDPSDDI